MGGGDIAFRAAEGVKYSKAMAMATTAPTLSTRPGPMEAMVLVTAVVTMVAEAVTIGGEPC